MKGTSFETTSMERVCIAGKMVGSSKGTGSTTKCMGLESSSGGMGDSMKALIKTTKRTGRICALEANALEPIWMRQLRGV